MPQTDYSLTPPRAMAGMKYNNRPADIVSAVNEEASAALPFGRMARTGAAEGGARLLSATGQLMLGVAVHEHLDPTKTGYAADEVGSFGKKGVYWVEVEEAIALGDQVFVRHTAGTASTIGAFRNDADTASCDELTDDLARWVGPSVSVGGTLYAPLSLNLV